jgi:PAS domain S-box-containing protein
MAVQKYAIQRPQAAGGGFEDRYWSPVNSPGLGSNGEVLYIVHRVEDVTEFIRLKEAESKHSLATEVLRSRAGEMEAEIFRRAQQIQQSNTKLRQELECRQRAETALLKSEEERKGFFNMSLDLLCVAGFDGYFKRLNPAWERVFGYSTTELMAEPYVNFIHPDDVTNTCIETERYAGGGQTVSFENRYRCKDGSYRWLSWNAIPSPEQLVYAVARDITDRKQAERTRREAEELLRRSHFLLEQRVEARTLELQAKNRDLETLLFITSHDLREPLRAVESFARLVHERYAERLDEKGRDFLRRIVRAAQRMDQLMVDLLSLSRAQRMELPTEDVEIAALVQDALRTLEGKVKDTNARIYVTKDLPRLRVDKTWGTQAIYNLIANALKFCRNGEAPDIEIEAYERSAESGPDVGLIVRDRGPGVAPEHAERIFQLFQRAVSREVEGTGAGLAIVRQVAERHGGRAWVQPRVGGGSEFVLTFGVLQTSEKNPS